MTDFASLRLFLAPMAGVTDHPFRACCMNCGAQACVTEMVSAKAVCHGNQNTQVLARVYEDERPCGIQLFGSEPETMAQAAATLEKLHCPDFIDINMGCPVPKVFGNGEGSALLANPSLCGEIVAAVHSAVSLPVTVKIRIGLDEAHRNAVEVARACESAGASAVFVHGRTRVQMYSGKADRSFIRAVRESVQIPVIANGDIASADDALAMLRDTGCHAIMIGRGALGRPWLFSAVAAALSCRPIPPEPSAERKRDIIRRHIQSVRAEKGDAALVQLRKHLSWYTRGQPCSASLRQEINVAETEQQFLALCDRIAFSEPD